MRIIVSPGNSRLACGGGNAIHLGIAGGRGSGGNRHGGRDMHGGGTGSQFGLSPRRARCFRRNPWPARCSAGLACRCSGRAAACARPVRPAGRQSKSIWKPALPGADRPDSMAYTMPYREGGARIHVFVDRVAAMVPPSRIGTVAGACAGTRNHARTAGREPPLRAGSDEGTLGYPRFPRHGGASATFRRPGRPIDTCRRQATQGQRAPHAAERVTWTGLI